ncbi:MAG: hypothetical protein ACRDYV_02820 [Acidimicrobiia bacterium]
MAEFLWATGGFPLADVLAGRAGCPPGVRTVVALAWRPPARRPGPEPEILRTPFPEDVGRVLARRASDFVRPRPGAAEEEATLRGAWEVALGVLRPLAALRIGPLDLVFAAPAGAASACRGLYDGLTLTRPSGDWRIGYARVEHHSFRAAVRALDLWVLDAGGAGSWLVDVTDLA